MQENNLEFCSPYMSQKYMVLCMTILKSACNYQFCNSVLKKLLSKLEVSFLNSD